MAQPAACSRAAAAADHAFVPETVMRILARSCLLALLGALLVCGCALRDPRDSYAYGRVADGLWDADYDLLVDWNYPTAANQGPLEAPKRFRPERTAIGVPWATGNPLAPPKEKGQAPAVEPSGAASADEQPAVTQRMPQPSADGRAHADARPVVALERASR
jgi:hypothetical protein